MLRGLNVVGHFGWFMSLSSCRVLECVSERLGCDLENFGNGFGWRVKVCRLEDLFSLGNLEAGRLTTGNAAERRMQKGTPGQVLALYGSSCVPIILALHNENNTLNGTHISGATHPNRSIYSRI